MNRTASITRTTKETDIAMTLKLDEPAGKFEGTTGIGFFDHMLNSFCVHGGFVIEANVAGDLQIDGHHTVEDVGIVLGKLFAQALGDKGGIMRFGESHVPMDEALAFCAVDVSGRAFLVYDIPVMAPMIGDYDTQLTEEFFRALAVNAEITLHVCAKYGQNDHHKVEAAYKATARAISAAVQPRAGGVLSAKGVL